MSYTEIIRVRFRNGFEEVVTIKFHSLPREQLPSSYQLWCENLQQQIRRSIAAEGQFAAEYEVNRSLRVCEHSRVVRIAPTHAESFVCMRLFVDSFSRQPRARGYDETLVAELLRSNRIPLTRSTQSAATLARVIEEHLSFYEFQLQQPISDEHTSFAEATDEVSKWARALAFVREVEAARGGSNSTRASVADKWLQQVAGLIDAAASGRDKKVTTILLPITWRQKYSRTRLVVRCRQSIGVGR